MMEVGVANPSAQGQATIRTATEFRSANVNAGSGPNANHKPKVSMAIPMTMGTKTAATRSTNLATGGLDP